MLTRFPFKAMWKSQVPMTGIMAKRAKKLNLLEKEIKVIVDEVVLPENREQRHEPHVGP